VPIEQRELLQSIYDSIFDALTTAPPGIGDGRPIANINTTYMALIMPGIGVDPTQFANMWSPGNPQGDAAAAENFALLVDDVPTLFPIYRSSGVGIDGLYGEIVDANVAPAPPDPEGQAAFDRADSILHSDGMDIDDLGRPVTTRVDSPVFLNYQRKRRLYEAELLNYVSTFISFDLSDPVQARKWALVGPILQAPLERAFADLQTARPGVIESAIATMGQFQLSSRARIFEEARQIYTQTRRASQLPGNPQWHTCLPFPGNWFTESAKASFTTMTVDSTSLRINESSRFTAVGGGAASTLVYSELVDQLATRVLSRTSARRLTA